MSSSIRRWKFARECDCLADGSRIASSMFSRRARFPLRPWNVPACRGQKASLLRSSVAPPFLCSSGHDGDVVHRQLHFLVVALVGLGNSSSILAVKFGARMRLLRRWAADRVQHGVPPRTNSAYAPGIVSGLPVGSCPSLEAWLSASSFCSPCTTPRRCDRRSLLVGRPCKSWAMSSSSCHSRSEPESDRLADGQQGENNGVGSRTHGVHPPR